MKTWLPEHSGIKFSSYPNQLVETWFSTAASHFDGTQFQEGHITTMLPVGTPLRIEKVVDYQALDEVSRNVLGTLQNPVTHKEMRFNFDYRSVDRIPWSLTRK